MEPENDDFPKTLYRFQGSHLQVKHLQLGSLEFSLKTIRVNFHDNFLSVCSFERSYHSIIPPKKKNYTLPKTNMSPKRDYFNRKYIFQPSIFRGHVSFQEGRLSDLPHTPRMLAHHDDEDCYYTPEI